MYRIIIADDEKMARDRVSRYLAQVHNAEVVASMWNGQQVQDYLERNTADLVIADIRMPLVDGLELAEWIHNSRPECQVILISAYEDFSYALKAIKLGVKSYLKKPIRQNELVAMVEQLYQERNAYESKNLYVQNLQTGVISQKLKYWIKNPKEKIPEELHNISGCLISFEDNRDFSGNRELLPVALDNVLHWTASKCNCIFLGKRGWRYLFAVLYEKEDHLPDINELDARVLRLLGLTFYASNKGSFQGAEQLQNLVENIDGGDAESLAPVLKYIENHLADAVRRDEVAAIACMTPAYFSRYFKEKTGYSFQDYVQWLRMEEAKKLLQQGVSVKDICLRIGYQDRNYFNQSFRKYTGTSPAEYRKLYK